MKPDPQVFQLKLRTPGTMRTGRVSIRYGKDNNRSVPGTCKKKVNQRNLRRH